MIPDEITIKGVDYVSSAVAAEMIGITPSAVRYRARRDTLPHILIGSGKRGVLYIEKAAAAQAQKGVPLKSENRK